MDRSTERPDYGEMIEKMAARSRERQLDIIARSEFSRDLTDLGDQVFVCITTVNPDDVPPPPPPPSPPAPPPPPPPPEGEGEDDDDEPVVDDTGYPKVAQSYFYCQICQIGGIQKGGSAGTITPLQDQYLYALNVGPKWPPPNSRVLVKTTGSRATFRYRG